MRFGLSMRVVQADGYDEPRDAISHDWLRWLSKLGHLGIPLPNISNSPAGLLDEMNIDALVLTGGNDVVPRPGAEDDTAKERTRNEFALIEDAIARQIPILGTCRGLHIVNLYFGGSVISDLCEGPFDCHVAQNHTVFLDRYWSQLTGEDAILTNSFHNQALTENELSDHLRAFARSNDGIVEGLVHPDHAIVAVQWHPERPNPATNFDINLLDSVLSNGAFWREVYH